MVRAVFDCLCSIGQGGVFKVPRVIGFCSVIILERFSAVTVGRTTICEKWQCSLAQEVAVLYSHYSVEPPAWVPSKGG